jgi:rhamnosyltransferase
MVGGGQGRPLAANETAVIVKVSVIIPTLQAGARLAALLDALRRQTLQASEILVVDSTSDDGTADLARRAGCRVEVIPRRAFDHGGTRNLAARRADGDTLVFMTQDALPASDGFLETLVHPLGDGRAAAAYARQVASPGAPPGEVFARRFNYPEASVRRTLADLPRLGIRTFFMSDVASAVGRGPFEAVGGFPDRVIMSEDMLLCARLLRHGYTVAYEAAAVVLHDHRYTLGQTFKRYFDIGVLRKEAGDALAGARWSGQGLCFARQLFAFLLRSGAWTSLPRAAAETVLKAAAVQLGARHRRIPASVKQRLSLHPAFWSDSGSAP